MQLDFLFLRARPRPEPPRPSAPATGAVFVRHRRARRYILRVRPDGVVRVTIPRGGSRAEAVKFLENHSDWVTRERQRIRASASDRRWLEGSAVMFEGAPVVLRVDGEGGARTVGYAGRTVRIPVDAVDLRPFVERDLRAFARETLEPRVHALAGLHSLTVRSVRVRNQRSRWGSCSARGSIALNFRLVQMPSEVRDYVLLHELMHLEQRNHSVRFWRLVQAACPGFREAERWLKTEGRGLF